MGGGQYIEPSQIKIEKIDEEAWLDLIREARSSITRVEILKYEI